jgi:anti-anti-sigma factor
VVSYTKIKQTYEESALDLQIEENIDNIVVKFSGEMDMLSIKSIKDKLFGLIDHKNNIVLDFENLEYLDSTGIGILLTLNRMQMDNDCTLSLTNVPPKIESILRLSSLSDILL